MAYIPILDIFEETLATNYDLSLGTTSFVAAEDVAIYTLVSIQAVGANIVGNNQFVLEQSNDGTNYDEIQDAGFTLNNQTSQVTTEKINFSGKYLRVRIATANSGTVSLYLVAKK